MATGKDEIRPRYEKRFSTPVHAKLVGRLNVGNVSLAHAFAAAQRFPLADCVAAILVLLVLLLLISFSIFKHCSLLYLHADFWTRDLCLCPRLMVGCHGSRAHHRPPR
eukprot:1021621-Rhodomonas_salina.2